MKRILLVLAALLAVVLPEAALAQLVTQSPTFISPNVANDLGNGPLELRIAQGNALVGTSQGSSTATAGTSGSPNLTVALNLATPPCVGCLVSGTGVTSGTSVVSYTPGTGVIVLSANLTANASGVYSFGAACPATQVIPVLPVQAGVTPDTPFYTQARICGYAQYAPGAQVLVFPIGAH